MEQGKCTVSSGPAPNSLPTAPLNPSAATAGSYAIAGETCSQSSSGRAPYVASFTAAPSALLCNSTDPPSTSSLVGLNIISPSIRRQRKKKNRTIICGRSDHREQVAAFVSAPRGRLALILSTIGILLLELSVKYFIAICIYFCFCYDYGLCSQVRSSTGKICPAW